MKSSGGIVCAGVVDGNDGYSTVVVQLFRRSDSVLGNNDRPNRTLTYNFTDGVLRNPQGQTSGTGFNGWSQAMPDASTGAKLYVITATASSTTDTAEISANKWSTPVEYVLDGDKGYGIALTLIRDNLYTDANWNTYAALNHSESYSKQTGDGDFTSCRVGDYFVVTGKSSDSNISHTATYRCTSVSANSITGTCVSHTHDGDKGNKGDTGRMFYIAGEWDSKTSYTRDSKICPIVHHKVEGVNDEYWYLDADSSLNNIPSENSEYWKKASNFGIVMTEALFAKFAKLGSFVVAGDFFISQCGVLVAKDSTKVINGNNASSKQYYSNGIKAAIGMPAYMYFDANDPMAEDVLSGSNNTFTINGNHEMDGIFVKRIYFYASSATTIKVTITPSSEDGYDFGAVGFLDHETLSDAEVDAGSIRDGDTTVFVKASGTVVASGAMSVSMGAHFFEIGYFKDNSDDINNDNAAFKFEEVGNSYVGGFSELKFRPKKVVNARTGEEWTAGGKVRVDKNGNVSLHDLEANDIIVNNATIKGSLMYNKVVCEYSLTSIALADSNTTIHTAMKANIFVIGNAYSPFNVSFPPAYLFPGAQVKIVLGLTELITLSLFVTRLSGEQAKYPADQSAAGWPPYNAFFAAIPIKNTGGTTVVGRFDSIEVNKYRSIDLVSVQNTGSGQRDYYYWMIVDAKE